MLCDACGNYLTSVGPVCLDCLPTPSVRVLPDACYDCKDSETACAGTWAIEDKPCCTGCSHG